MLRGNPSTASEQAGWALAVVVLGAVATLMLLPLVRPAIDWDARATWFQHARWFYGGGEFVQRAIGNAAHGYNRDYPPLVPATVASFWRSGAGVDHRSGQILVGILNASAVVVAALAIPRTFRLARLGPASLLMSAAWVVAAFGIAKEFGTDGYADLLWAAAATGAVLYLLVAPIESTNGSIGVVLLLVSALTKNDAIAPALVVAVLAALRYRALLRRTPWVPALSPLLVVWPLLARRFGADPLYEPGAVFDLLRGDSSVWNRLEPTLRAMRPLLLWPAAVAIFVAIVGTVALSDERRGLALGGCWRLWAVWVVACISLVAAYLVSGLTLVDHLGSSIDRTTMAAQLLLLTEIAVWSLVAMAALAARSRSGTAPEPPPRDAA
ncbi:MAG: hypothetical protein FJW88_01175 [Actinobacteria bacterium]|nr:hypothetical protein [Actinomycetota bacterium]